MKKRKANKKTGVIANNFRMLGKIWHYTPAYVIWMVIEGIVWGAYHAIGLIYSKTLYDAVGENAGFPVALGIVLCYGGYCLLFRCFDQWYWRMYNRYIREKLHAALHEELFRQAVRIDLEKYDDPEFYNDFVWAMDKSSTQAEALMEDTGKLINRLVASVTLTGVLVTVDPVMSAIVFATVILQITLSFAHNRIQLRCEEELNPVDRKDAYIQRIFSLPDYAKEMRTTEVSELLFQRHRENADQKIELLHRYGKQYTLLDTVTHLTAPTADTAVLLLALYRVMVTGTMGLGGVAVAVEACGVMNWLLGDLVKRLMKYQKHGSFMEKMLRFLEQEPKICDGPLEAAPFESLELRNVTFAYPGTGERAALDNVCLRFERGDKIAVVGYNGAGKTTLTKLLLRLYDPDSGVILYNGKDLKEYRLESLRRRMAAVFQDYRIFSCTLGENVAGGAWAPEDRERICRALEQSTFPEQAEAMEKGLDTVLTREFDDTGVQLSGGEQQKVALARAFYRDADLVILDEPSSALDPDAEYALNQSIYNYGGSRTVVFISHRLSTTRHADKIYMFDSGVMIESGTHGELMESDGKYAYMFRLQAQKYTEQKEAENGETDCCHM